MNAPFKHVVIALCAYEVVACATGRMPTLTALQQRYRVIGPLLVGGLLFHFYQDDLRDLRG